MNILLRQVKKIVLGSKKVDWLVNYDPEDAIDELVERYGQFGMEVLNAYNDADPFNIGIGEMNPDEYLPETKNFLVEILTPSGIVTAVASTLQEDRNLVDDFDGKCLDIANQIMLNRVPKLP